MFNRNIKVGFVKKTNIYVNRTQRNKHTVMNKQQNLLQSFYNAFSGIKYFFLHDRNGKIHLAAAIAVIAVSFVLKLTPGEWATVLLCIAIVTALEMMNAAIENLCDLVEANFHPVVKIIKDVSAAAVLFCAIVSAVIACIIFIPKIIQLLS